jgi:nucleoid-associated protein YgaU
MIPALASPRFYAAVPQESATVTVQRGDTLWTLAERQTRDGGNVQQTLDAIVSANHLAGVAIFPGQRIKIPR